MVMENAMTLAEYSQKTGIKGFTLAFATGGLAGCTPMWGGKEKLNDEKIMKQINDFKKHGGQVIVALGGAMGPYLEQSCGSVDDLAKAYKQILDTVGTDHLDLDIEASIPTDKMNQALAKVQKERPKTTVSFTLTVQGDDYGLTDALGVDILKNAVKHGVRVDIVNPMAMEFWTDKKSWGDAVVNTGNGVLRQMKKIWPNKSDAELKSMLGITPMIGRNFNGKLYQLDHAKQLVHWANDNHIGRLAFWSMGRDNGGCNGQVSPKCSGVEQHPLDFSNIFKGFQ